MRYQAALHPDGFRNDFAVTASDELPNICVEIGTFPHRYRKDSITPISGICKSKMSCVDNSPYMMVPSRNMPGIRRSVVPNLSLIHI